MFEFRINGEPVKAYDNFRIQLSATGRSQSSLDIDMGGRMPEAYDKVVMLRNGQPRWAGIVSAVSVKPNLIGSDAPTVCSLTMQPLECDLDRIIPIFSFCSESASAIAESLFDNHAASQYDWLFDSFSFGWMCDKDITYERFQNQSNTLKDAFDKIAEDNAAFWRIDIIPLAGGRSQGYLTFWPIGMESFAAIDLNEPYEAYGETLEFSNAKESANNSKYRNRQMVRSMIISNPTVRTVELPVWNRYYDYDADEWKTAPSDNTRDATASVLGGQDQLPHPITGITAATSNGVFDIMPYVGQYTGDESHDSQYRILWEDGSRTLRWNPATTSVDPFPYGQWYEFTVTEIRNVMLIRSKPDEVERIAAKGGNGRVDSYEALGGTYDAAEVIGYINGKLDLNSKPNDTLSVRAHGFAWAASQTIPEQDITYAGLAFRIAPFGQSEAKAYYLHSISIRMEIASDDRLTMDMTFKTDSPFVSPASLLERGKVWEWNEGEEIFDGVAVSEKMELTDAYRIGYDIPLYAGSDSGLPELIQVMQDYY